MLLWLALDGELMRWASIGLEMSSLLEIVGGAIGSGRLVSIATISHAS